MLKSIGKQFGESVESVLKKENKAIRPHHNVSVRCGKLLRM